ncbi:hypothetical protein ABKN59_000806 [Abortiporus biennis]
MVSALWKACAEGDLEKTSALLNEGAPIDLEIKDHTGVTPLIAAIQGGHSDIVKILLDKGADPHNGSSQGPPEQYTSDPAILELLTTAKMQVAPNGLPTEPMYPNGSAELAGQYYPPPGPYYYPGMPVPPQVLPDGSVAYYPPPPVDNNGLPNLPPPDIARMIPCRYYPACRYGSSCIFAHPQGPYIQGPLPPPAQYPAPYDPITPAPYPAYYTVTPPAFPPNGSAMSPVSPVPGSSPSPLAGPHPPIVHARSNSELLSPVQTTFNPAGVPPPISYGMVSPMSPTYGHPGPIPVPIAIPPHPAAHIPGPQSPQHALYPPTSPTAPGGVPPHFIAQGNVFQPQMSALNGNMDSTVSPKSPRLQPQMDGYNGPIGRDGFPHHRRGGIRRPSFGIRGKPPCLFFPSGRCKNGDDCRFPHVMPDGSAPHHLPHFASRGGHRPRPGTHLNGIAAVEDKLATMNIQDDVRQSQNNSGPISNGTAAPDGSSRSQSTEPPTRPRGYGYKNNTQYVNGARLDKKPAAPRPQRVPSADEFPVLAGTSTPPLRSPGVNGPTAAQVLQAPPPVRKDSQPGTRGASPDSSCPTKENKVEPTSAVPATTTVPEPVVNKTPLSFAAAAAVPDAAAKEVSVSA